MDEYLKEIIVNSCIEKKLDVGRTTTKSIKYKYLIQTDESDVEKIKNNILIGVYAYVHLKDESEKTIGHVVFQLDEFDLK